MKLYDFTQQTSSENPNMLRKQVAEVLKLLKKNADSDAEKQESVDLQLVNAIIKQVRLEGDVALKRLSAQYDGYFKDSFLVSEDDFDAAELFVTAPLKAVIEEAKANIEAYHKHQVTADWSFSPKEGVCLGQRIKPIRRVGLYIPGGKAAYPSTVLMNGIPALIAGVKEIAIFTPPGADGKVNPLVLYAARQLGISEVYALGGAQAIAAAAYGTDEIPSVDKIVGPGNRYVTLAKKLVFGDVAIDMIAGPSEVLIVADLGANPKWIAADLLAQAEHDEDAALYLVTTAQNLPLQVANALENQLKTLPKADIARKAIQNNCHVFLVDTLEKGLKIANCIAPEHLELMVKNPQLALESIEQAGSVFLGAYTPEALGDYIAGTNHTLPTSGTARFSSPLGVYDFIKRPSFLSYSKEALMAAANSVTTFAQAEGLEAHKRSVEIRLYKLN